MDNCPIALGGGRDTLYQWDTGQTVVVDPAYDVSTVEVCRFGASIAATAQRLPSGEYKIPDVILTTSDGVEVFAVLRKSSDEAYTRQRFAFDVLPRPRPDDYVDPEDWPRWHWLDERIDALADIVGTKTEKVELQLISGKIRRGDDELDFRQLVELLKQTPDFVYLLSGGWVYLPSYVQDTGTVQYVRFGSTIISAQIAKSSAMYIESIDGETIRGISVTTVNSENASNKVETVTDDSMGSTTLYPSVRAMVDYVEEHAPSTEIDATLTVEGAAADAKAVGDRIEGIDNEITDIENTGVYTYEQQLTSEQQAQARENIAAWGEFDFNDAIPFVTPEQYGAVGDGATDDTAAVSSALNSGKVVVGSGTYLIKQTITSVGAMAVGCKFILDNTSGNEFTFIFKGNDIRLKNCSFTVVPYADASNKETRNGVCLRDCDNVIVDGCTFTAKNANVNGYFDLYSNWKNVRVLNCTFDVDTEYEGEIHMGGIWARDFYKKGSSNLIFGGCTVNHHTKDECLAVWSTESNLNNVVVRDCTFYATGMPNCIKYGGINDLLVSNINVVTDAYAFLVTLVYHNSQGSNMKFVDSTFTSLAQPQKTIYSRNSDRILFRGCTFTGSSFNADGNLDFEDCKITATENPSTNMGDVVFRGCDLMITQTANAFSKSISKFRDCRITSTGNFMQFTSATTVVEVDCCKINSGDNKFIIGSTDVAKTISRCDFLGQNQYNLYNFRETDAVLFNVFDVRPSVNAQTNLIGIGTNYIKSTHSVL